MRKITVAVVYTALALLANAAAADQAALMALRDGDMGKLNFASDPAMAADTAFLDETGAEMHLSDLRGKVVLVNFWATWCAPCRVEMPHLAALQTARGGDDFQVVTIATGRNAPQAIARFFDEIGVTNLPRYADPQQALAHDMGVMGLPVSLILDRDGAEVARMMGDADWSSPSAMAIIDALLATGAGQSLPAN